jgi:hypothetical protein
MHKPVAATIRSPPATPGTVSGTVKRLSSEAGCVITPHGPRLAANGNTSKARIIFREPRALCLAPLL